jgi:hypothetical protein
MQVLTLQTSGGKRTEGRHLRLCEQIRADPIPSGAERSVHLRLVRSVEAAALPLDRASLGVLIVNGMAGRGNECGTDSSAEGVNKALSCCPTSTESRRSETPNDAFRLAVAGALL